LNDPQTLNLYGYVRNNPLERPDVDGHQFLKKLKNWFTNGGWTDDDKEAEKTRHDRRVKVARFYANEWAKEHRRSGFDPSKYSDEQILSAFNNGAFSKTADDPFDPLQLLGIVTVVQGSINPQQVVDYIDTTRGGSVRNITTNVTPDEFGKTLESNGFTKSVSADGKATNYSKGNTKYSVYPNATSTGGPSAQVIKDGKTIAKIRLK